MFLNIKNASKIHTFSIVGLLCLVIFAHKMKIIKYNKMNKATPFFSYTADNIHPGFSVDCVILTFHKKKLRVLLNKFDFSDYWQLPGGFMFKHENADDAAERILTARTGLTGLYLRQFYLFSDPERTKMNQNQEYLSSSFKENDSIVNYEKWFLQRFVSLGYLAFAKYDQVALVSTKQDTAKWFDIQDLPSLYSDHEYIIKTALEMMNFLLSIIPVGYELLPEKFTMGELRKLYECVSGKTFDRRNFQRKVLATGIVVPLDEVKGQSLYNSAILYSFEKDKKDTIDFSLF